MDKSTLISEMIEQSNSLFVSALDAVDEKIQAEDGKVSFSALVPEWIELSRKVTIQAIVEVLATNDLLKLDQSSQ